MNYDLAFTSDHRIQEVDPPTAADYMERAQKLKPTIKIGNSIVNIGLNECGIVFVMIDTGFGNISLTERV